LRDALVCLSCTPTRSSGSYSLSLHDALPILGLLQLVAAWKEVVRQHPDALLYIGGTGPLQEALETEIQLNGLEQNVHMLGFIPRSEEHTSELQSRENLVCRLLLEKKKETNNQ